jgi:hypothetical protein
MQRTIYMVLLALTIGGPLYADEPAPQPAEASCVVRLEMDPMLGLKQPRLMDRLIQGSSVAGQAAREVLGPPQGDTVEGRGYRLDVEIYPMLPGTMNIILRAELARAPADGDGAVLAEQFLEAVTVNLGQAIARTHQQVADHRAKRTAQILAQLEESRARVRELQSGLQAVAERAGNTVLSLEEVRGDLRGLSERIRELNMELEVGRVVSKRLEQQIELAANEAEESVASDVVLSELGEMLKIKQQVAAGMTEKYKQGRATQEEVLQAQMELAEVKIRMANRRQELLSTANGRRLIGLKEQLSQRLIQLAELEARLAVSEQLLRDMRDRNLLGLAQEYEILNRQISAARDGLLRDEEASRRARRKAESTIEPQLIVIE